MFCCSFPFSHILYKRGTHVPLLPIKKRDPSGSSKHFQRRVNTLFLYPLHQMTEDLLCISNARRGSTLFLSPSRGHPVPPLPTQEREHSSSSTPIYMYVGEGTFLLNPIYTTFVKMPTQSGEDFVNSSSALPSSQTNMCSISSRLQC